MGVELSGLYDGRLFPEAALAVNALSNDLDEGRRVVLPRVVKRALENYMVRVLIEVTNRNNGAYPGGTTATSLSSRSGAGIRSLRENSKVSGNTLSTLRMYVGGLDYMLLHERGGVIKPKRGKYLTIPLPEALNSDGTPKKRTAREWNDTFVQKSKAGNLLIFQKRGGSIVPLYTLKTSVTIPARLGLALTFEKGIGQFLDDVRNKVKLEFMNG